MGKYYLLDLERTISNGAPYYWKLNKHGYTPHIANAGLFQKDIAEKICEIDMDQTTVKVHQDLILRFLGKESNLRGNKV